MFQRFLTVFLGIIVLGCMMLLAACGASKPDDGASNSGTNPLSEIGQGDQGDNKPQPDPPEQNEPPQDPAPAPAEIAIMTTAGHTAESFEQRFGDSIRKKFPQHTIKYIEGINLAKLPDFVASNETVDIVYAAVLDFARGPLQYDMVQDLSELVKQHNIHLNKVGIKWAEGLSSMWEGKLYGLPISVESLALFYNLDLFDKFGVQTPADGMTWEEVFELNRTLSRTEDDQYYAGLVIAMAQHFSLNALSVPYVNPSTEKSTITSEEAKWKTLYETLAQLPLSATGYKDNAIKLGRLPNESDFRNQQATMLAGLVHAPLSYSEMVDMNWDMVSYPTFKEMPNSGAQGNLLLFGITKQSKVKEQAMEVVKYLYSEEFQVTTSRDGNLPIIVNEQTVNEFAQNTYYKDRNVQSAFYYTWAPLSLRTIYDGDVVGIYRNYIMDLVKGDMDLNTMMRTIEEEVNRTIEEKKAGNK